MWGEEKLERAIVIKLYTSCTVWEFKSEVAKLYVAARFEEQRNYHGQKSLN